MGLDVIKNLFTGSASTLIDSAKGLISQFVQNPEDKAKALEALEAEKNKHIETLMAQVTELQVAELKDAQSARDREISIVNSQNAPLLNKIIQPILALVIVGATFTLWSLILFRSYEPKVNEAMIIGSLTTMSAGVIAYYFGSSTGSKAKSDQINTMINK